MKLFSLNKKSTLHLSQDKKIVPQEEFSELLEAKDLLEKAKKEAESVKKQTEKGNNSIMCLPLQ